MNSHVNYHDEMRRRMKIKVHLEVGEILMGGRSVFHPEMRLEPRKIKLARIFRLLFAEFIQKNSSVQDPAIVQKGRISV